jgi:hypothetical protein
MRDGERFGDLADELDRAVDVTPRPAMRRSVLPSTSSIAT